MAAIAPKPMAATQTGQRIRHSLRQVASSRSRWAKILFTSMGLGCAIALIALAGKWFGAELPQFEQWIQSLGWWGPVAFTLVFLGLTLLQIPEFMLAIAGGVAFGLWEGSIVVISANIVAALAAFFIYRLLFRQRFEQMLKRHPKTHAIESAVSAQGFKLIVLLRLGPFNFSLLNAILGASNVRLTPFLFSLIGVIPGNFATVYFGTVARHVAQKSAGVDNLDLSHEISLFVGFAVTIIACLFVAHVARHALEQVESEKDSQPSTPPE